MFRKVSVCPTCYWSSETSGLQRDQFLGGWRDSDGSLEDDALRFEFSRNAGLGVVVGGERQEPAREIPRRDRARCE